MTNATSEVLQKFIDNQSFTYITTTTAGIAVALLIAVLLERELLRATASGDMRRNLTSFAVVLVPMMIVFVFVIVSRFMKLS